MAFPTTGCAGFERAHPLTGLFFTGLLALSINGCTSVTDKAPEGAQEASVDGELLEERDAILAQPNIDPLTDFIRRHKDNPDADELVEAIRAERKSRCENIYTLYKSRAPDLANLSRLKKHYNNSCPGVVARYIDEWEGSLITKEPEPEETFSVNHPCHSAFSQQKTLRTLDSCTNLAIKGNADAQYFLAVSHRRLARYDEAFFWAEKSAANKHTDAQFFLGDLYGNGHGVQKDEQKAFQLKELAASQGHTAAQLDIARYYLLGTGTEVNPRMARFWYRSAADKGSILAQLQLGEIYKTGILGKVELEKAVSWYKKAARKGSSRALFNLGKIYSNTDYEQATTTEAYLWFRLADLAGNPFAITELEALETSIPAETRSRLDRKADELIRTMAY